MINGVNLIPQYRREARYRRRYARLWISSGLIYAIALIGLWCFAHIIWSSGSEAVAVDLARVQSDISDTENAMDELRPCLVEVQARLAASRSIGDQPDWSILLRLLASLLDDQTVLEEIKLEPVYDNAEQRGYTSSAGYARDTRSISKYALKLSGLGRSHQAVQNYVIRLEHTGLFSRVTLVDTHKKPYLSSDAVAFRIDGTFADGK